MAGALLAPASAAYDENPGSTWIPSGPVYAMAQYGNRIYLGGSFQNLRNPANGQRTNRQALAAVDATTGELIASWNPGANARVRALAVGPDGTVYAGGDFTTAAGQSAVRIAAIDPNGNAVPGWDASANNTVRDIWANGSGVYIAGNFGNVSGVSRPGLARLSAANGDVDAAFNANVSGRVRALTPSPDGQTLIVGGSFQRLSGATRVFAGSVDLASGDVTGWTPPRVCDSCALLDLATGDGRVYAAVGGGGGGRAAAWDLSSGARRWITHADGDVQAVAYYDGVLYAGGHYGPNIGSGTRHQLAALNATSGGLLGFSVPFNGNDHPGTWALIANASKLHVGGGFRGMAGSPAQRYAAFPTT